MKRLYYFLSFLVVLSFSCSKDSQMNPDQNIVKKLGKAKPVSMPHYPHPDLEIPPGLKVAYSKNGNPIPIQQWLIGQTDILEKACQHSTDCAVKMELVNQLFYLQNQLDVVGADDVECVNALCDGYLSVENTCVYITPKILRLKIGETQPTQAKIMVGSEICTGEIVWGNPYDDISTVDKDGNVTGVKIGSGRIGAWVVGLQFISGEERVEVYYKPEVETSSVTDIQGTSAIIGGNVINDNNDPVTEYGVFWGTTEDPVSTGTKLQIGSGTGSFSTILSGLIPGETYFIKAYAINNADIAYGNQVSFITKKPQIILTIRNASSWTTPCLFSLDWEYCLGTLSTVSNAVVKLYASQSSFDNNLPDFTATSDNNGIVNLYVPTPGQYFMLAEKGDLSNIKDGYVIFDVFDDISEIHFRPIQFDAHIGGFVYKDFLSDFLINADDQLWHDIIYVYENQTTIETVLIGK